MRERSPFSFPPIDPAPFPKMVDVVFGVYDRVFGECAIGEPEHLEVFDREFGSPYDD